MMRFLVGCLCFLLVACGRDAPVHRAFTDPGPAAKGGVLVQAMLGDPTNLVPFLAGESGAAAIGGSIYQSLLTYDGNLTLKGELAEHWEVSEGGKVITFTLKPGLTFSDGSPLTSADVLATFKVITNPTTRTPYAGDYLLVKKAEAPTPTTFRVTYAEAFVPALSSWAGLPILPAKEIAKTTDFNTTALKTKPLGSGSYVLSGWVRGQNLLLTANPSSSNPPLISKLFYRVIPDADTQFLELKAGHLSVGDLQPLAFARLTSAPWFTDSYNKIRYLSNAYTYLGFNLKNPLFADKAVRQALSFAIDREGIIQAVLFGQGLPMAGVFKPGTWAYNEKLIPYPYNPAKARAMLDAAGWKVNPKTGIREKNGTPFAFTVFTNQGNTERLKTAQIMQTMLADVGVRMEIRVQEWSTFLTNTIEPRKFDALLMGWGLGAEPDPYDIWYSTKTGPKEFNMISFSSPEADRLMDAARREFDQTKRKRLLDRFQEILHDEQPYLWLYAPYALVAVHKSIQGVSPAPAGIFYNQPQWYIPEKWQAFPAMQM